MSRSLGTLTLDLVAKTGSFTQGMDKAERSAKKMDAEYKRLKRSIDPAFAAQERFTKQSAVLKRELDRGAISLEQYTADMQRLEVAAGVTGVKATKNFGGSIQAAGYQVGDFAVQVASGQSALVAFTQQGSQLAGFFGPGGAVLGAVLAIGGAVAGYFVRSMQDGKDATEALTAAVQRLDDVLDEGDGVYTLASEIRELAKESEVAARARIVSAMTAAEQAARSAAGGIRDAFDEIADTVGFSDLSDFFADGIDTRTMSRAIADLRESLGLTGDAGYRAARTIFNALRDLDADPTIENFRALETVVSETSTTIGASSPALQKLVSDLSEYFDTARTAAERSEYLKKVVDDLSAAFSEDASAVDELVDKLQVQAATIGLNTLEMLEYSRAADLKEAADKGATEAQLDAIDAAYDKIYAHEQEAAAQKAATEAAKEAEKTQRDYLNLVASLRTEEERLADQIRERLALLDEVGGTSQDYARVAGAATSEAPEYGGLAPEVGGAFGELNKIDAAEQKLQEWYSTQLQMLERFRQERADLAAAWDAEELALKDQHEEELAKIEQARRTAQLVATKDVLSEMAEASKVYAGEQSKTYRLMFAASKAFTIAEASLRIKDALADAAAEGVTWQDKLAAMAAVGAATATIVSSIQGISLDGMAHSGIDSVPQDGTWLLQKGERVTTAETSAKLDATLDDIRRNGGGGAVQITVTNDGSLPAMEGRAERVGDEIKVIVSAVKRELSSDIGNGRGFARDLENRYALSKKGRI